MVEANGKGEVALSAGDVALNVPGSTVTQKNMTLLFAICAGDFFHNLVDGFAIGFAFKALNTLIVATCGRNFQSEALERALVFNDYQTGFEVANPAKGTLFNPAGRGNETNCKRVDPPTMVSTSPPPYPGAIR